MWAKNGLATASWQSIPERMAALGLSAEDGRTQVWFVEEDGLSGGAAAVNEALRLIWWARPLAIFYALPGIRGLEDRVYAWVAANRYRMPGSSASCRLPSSESEI